MFAFGYCYRSTRIWLSLFGFPLQPVAVLNTVWPWLAEPGAALLLSLSSLLAASPAVAAAATADAVSSAPTISYAASSPVAPEAVDSAVTQIIEAVKVNTIALSTTHNLLNSSQWEKHFSLQR